MTNDSSRRPARPSVRRRRYGNRYHYEAASGDRLTTRSRRGVVGRNWWAQRWSRLLGENSSPERLHRGRALARGGSVFRFRIEDGEARGEVRHSRTELHEVAIRQTPLGEDEWRRALDILASRALYVGALLGGRLEEELEEALDAAEVRLFPEALEELTMSCSCPDPGQPCSHLAAVFYLVAERLDRDPFLLFRFRGMRRDQILTECRQRRSATRALQGDGAFPLGGSDDETEAIAESVSEHKAGTGYFGEESVIDGIRVETPTEDGRDVLDELGPPPTVEAGSGSDRALREAYELGRNVASPPEEEPEEA